MNSKKWESQFFLRGKGKLLIRAAAALACLFFFLFLVPGGESGWEGRKGTGIGSGAPVQVYAASGNKSRHSDSEDEEEEEKKPESHDLYDPATSTNPFILPAQTWITPEARYGEPVYVVLPLVNMFKYNLTDVIVTPVLAAKTEEFPFEIDLAGMPVKAPVLVGENADPDPLHRAQNFVWLFRTRENVKTGYYKLDFQVAYTNPACVIETCTISTYVRLIGKPENGTVDGDEDDKKKSTPRVIVTGFTTEPGEVQAGSVFRLNLTIKNTSNRTSVNNMELDLTGTVTGKDEASSYAAFLPTSGANSFYVERIPAGGTTDLSMDFTAKADLEQKPYVMDIKMKYEDDEANPYEGSASVSIPVRQEAKFDTSAVEVQPSSIYVGEQADVMFSIYNTGKTKLYNVTVDIDAPSIESTMAYVGAIESGGTGNVDVMVTGIAPSEDNGTIDCIISYEDEAGNVTKKTKPATLVVMEEMEEDYGEMEDPEAMEEGGLTPLMRNLLLGGGVGAAVLAVLFFSLWARKKKRKKQEEKELAELMDEEE